MASTITGTGVSIDTINSYSVQCGWTSTPVGTIQLQGSNDDTTYLDITTQAAGGAAGNVLFGVPTPGYKYVRILYTRTSSSGTLTCLFFGKGTYVRPLFRRLALGLALFAACAYRFVFNPNANKWIES